MCDQGVLTVQLSQGPGLPVVVVAPFSGLPCCGSSASAKKRTRAFDFPGFTGIAALEDPTTYATRHGDWQDPL